jgi:hypothetical protein
MFRMNRPKKEPMQDRLSFCKDLTIKPWNTSKDEMCGIAFDAVRHGVEGNATLASFRSRSC